MSADTTLGTTGFTGFLSRLFCLFTVDTCKMHCFNLIGRKTKKATNARTAKKNHYPAVILYVKRIL